MPGVVRTPGKNGTTWHSDVIIYNGSAQTRAINVVYSYYTADGFQWTARKQLTFLPGEIKEWDDFVKAREGLEEEVLALVDASQQVADAIEQFRDVISENAFGLDLKKKDDLKKIQEARKIMLGLLDKHITTVKNNAKNERELNKHLANIGNYRQGTL